MSFTVIKHIICELTGYRPGTVDVSQGDRGSRAVSCRLMENGASWMIPEGATARVAYTLPDGTEGLYDRRPDGSPMWEISKNIVTVELADQLMAQAGMVQMSILVIGPEGGQLATWPIRVMVVADKPARLTVPESMPPYGAGFAGKIFFGGEDGTITPLEPGAGVEIVRQEDGTYALVAYGGAGGGGGITEEKDPTVPAWAKQPQKPTYTAEEVGALPKDTKIPGKTSELTNDAGFVDKAVDDLVNYYNKVQLQELTAAIPRFRVTVVQQLPAAGEDLVLYLVPFATAEGQYLEYIWVDGRWEIIGSQRVDLTGYATEVWVKEYVEEHSGQNAALTATERSTLIAVVNAIGVFDAPNGGELLAAFNAAWGGSGGETPDVPEQPAKTLTGISAAYSGGSVPVGTDVSALTGVVVTARYSDGSTDIVTGYTLSGAIAEGSNTITVSYGGKTATFVVTGVAESGGSDAVNLYSGSYLKSANIDGHTENGNVLTYTPTQSGASITYTIEGLEADKEYTIFVESTRTDGGTKYTQVSVNTGSAASYDGKLVSLYPSWAGAGKNYATFTANGKTMYLWCAETGANVGGTTPTLTVYIYEGALTEKP